MRPVGKQRDAGQQPADLLLGRRMAEHRQGKRRLGHEHVARDRHEAGAGGIGGALVVAADHRPRALVLHRHLGAAQHMPGRLQPDTHVADAQRLAPVQRLLRLPCPLLAQPCAHQRQRVGARQHRAMAGTRVIGMRVGDHRAVHRPGRIDEEAAGLAVQPLRQDAQPVRRMQHDADTWQRFPPAARPNRTAAMDRNIAGTLCRLVRRARAGRRGGTSLRCWTPRAPATACC